MSEDFMIQVFAVTVFAILAAFITLVAKRCYCK